MGLLQAEIASPPSIASQCLRHLQMQRAAHILLPVHLLPVIIFPLCHLPSQGILNEEVSWVPHRVTAASSHPTVLPGSRAPQGAGGSASFPELCQKPLQCQT